MNHFDLEQLKSFYSTVNLPFHRWETRAVKVGDVGIGGSNPIRVQSMTTTDTMDTMATVEQSIRMIEAGCELIRITAPSKKEAENLQNIKNELRKRGYHAPLVADIHFTPNAAEIAAQIVEKVRINPGNYADKKKFEVIDYTEASYQEELDRIRERFTPLVRICKEHGTAMRIGTNHGSLSDRILSRYGDTPEGMVESAMEFLRICRDENYHEIVLSMKASNTLVMVQAYRLLVATMRAEQMNYPLHLGVTEAGEAEDGRIKSAVGIGTLLHEGIGDTVRVSLTEDPEFEAPVARKLVEQLPLHAPAAKATPLEPAVSPFAHSRLETASVGHVGGKHVPIVVATRSLGEWKAASLFPYGYQYSVPLDKWNIHDQAIDCLYTGQHVLDFEIPGTLSVWIDYAAWRTSDKPRERHYPVLSLSDWKNHGGGELPPGWILRLSVQDVVQTDVLTNPHNAILWLDIPAENPIAQSKNAIARIKSMGVLQPIVAVWSSRETDEESFMLESSAVLGSLLIDGLIDGVMLHNDGIRAQLVNQIAFGILQAARTRISKTEYISCPSCGRTLFDLQETTARIRAKTDHLKGIKIGIMGCIVNGPGEMADADYGYVGVGVGKINLYKEKTVVKKNVPTESAVDELINLIKEHGDWIEKNTE